MAETQDGGRLGFLDSLTRLFRSKEERPTAQPAAPATEFDALRARFEAAVRGVDEKIAEHQKEQGASGPGVDATGISAKKLAEERKRRTEAAYRAMGEDIAKMHERLATGITGTDLDELSRYVADLDAQAQAGKDSHELLPRARYVIADRFQNEAGQLAVARIVELLQHQKLGWPDPTHYHPGATEEEIERSRRRRLAEVRESFLAQGLAKTSQRMLGIVSAWGWDYPDRGTALWEETVLEGVASGIRARLVKEFTEVLRRDRETIFTMTEAVIGKELGALQDSLKGGAVSLEQAHLAVASSLRVLDQILPQIAWDHVRSQLPHARGEWSA